MAFKKNRNNVSSQIPVNEETLKEIREFLNTATRQNKEFMRNAGVEFNEALREIRSQKAKNAKANEKFKRAFSRLIAGRVLAKRLEGKDLAQMNYSALMAYTDPAIYEKFTEIVFRSKAVNKTIESLASNNKNYIAEEGQLISNEGVPATALGHVIDTFDSYEAGELQEDEPSLESLAASPEEADDKLLGMFPMSPVKNLVESIREIPLEDTTTMGRSLMERALPSVEALLAQMQTAHMLDTDAYTKYQGLLTQFREAVQDARAALTNPDQTKLANITSELANGLTAEALKEGRTFEQRFILQTLAGSVETGRKQLAGEITSSLTAADAFTAMEERLSHTSRGFFHRNSSQSKEMRAIREAMTAVKDVLKREKEAGGDQKKLARIAREKQEACHKLEEACRIYLDPATKKAENERKHIVRDILAQNAALLGRGAEVLDSRSAVGKLLNAILAEPAIGQKEYKAVIDSLKALDDKIEHYFAPDENNKLVPFKEEDRKELLELYLQAARSVNSFFESHSNKRSQAYRMMETAATLIEQDMDHLGNLNLANEADRFLPDIISDARVKTVEADLTKLQTIGANSSQRFPISVDGTDGMFTKEETVDAMPAFEKYFSELQAEARQNPEVPDKFKDFINEGHFLENWLAAARKEAADRGATPDKISYFCGDKWETASIGENPDLRTVLDYFILSVINKEGTKLDEEACMTQFLFVKEPGIFSKCQDQNDITQIMYNYEWTPDKTEVTACCMNLVNVIFEKFIKPFGNKAFSSCLATWNLKLAPEERLDSRNSAMSAMAALLGCPKLLAKSIPMRLETTEGTINGTFMEKAEGVDPGSPDPEIVKKLKAAKVPVKIHPDVLKDIANLQVLDYLCGNVDRHGANFFYQFEPGSLENGTPVIKNIIGIDNDASFGTFVPKNRQGFMKMVGCDHMNVMSESMANNVMNMTPELMTFALRNHHVSSKAIEAAKVRLQNLQASIRESKKYYDGAEAKNELQKDPTFFKPGMIRILKDSDWNKMTIDHLEAHPKGTFRGNLFYFANNVGNLTKTKMASKQITFQKVTVK